MAGMYGAITQAALIDGAAQAHTSTVTRFHRCTFERAPCAVILSNRFRGAGTNILFDQTVFQATTRGGVDIGLRYDIAFAHAYGEDVPSRKGWKPDTAYKLVNPQGVADAVWNRGGMYTLTSEGAPPGISAPAEATAPHLGLIPFAVAPTGQAGDICVTRDAAGTVKLHFHDGSTWKDVKLA